MPDEWVVTVGSDMSHGCKVRAELRRGGVRVASTVMPSSCSNLLPMEQLNEGAQPQPGVPPTWVGQHQ